ncbi:alpha/beta hydrolase [Tardiphaga alba]|nr:alpha/beta hydrolase-fold protein [Tardiphaga alba]
MQANSQQSVSSMPNMMLPGASVRDIVSKAQRDYRIFVWQPAVGQLHDKMPVVYLLDGNGTFPIATSAVALQSRRPERTGVQPAIVVGIGYPTTLWLDAERRTYDYTPPVPEDALPQRPDRGGWTRTGGADEFLDFIADELQPMIAAEFGADRDQSALFGHSFGGLFVLHTLFTRPALFRNYAAASPSIWFGGDHLQQAKARFMAAKPTVPTRRLLVTVGGLEQAEAQSADGASADYDSWIRRNKMVENAKGLAADLATMDPAALAVTYTEFEDENHASVLPAAISRALRFSLMSGT